MEPTLVVGPGPAPRRLRDASGAILSVPEGWELLPPGDAGLTRRVKAAGPSWTVVEKRGRKKFSQGVWAPAANIVAARQGLDEERADPSYAKRLESAARRRDRDQAAYVEDFESSVLAFLRFHPRFEVLAESLAKAVTIHATPVGSGTVARTKRIPVEQRAEAAVIAWLRHQTTAYDHMHIARVKGLRRQVRGELAEISRALLDLHRRDAAHEARACPLCKTIPAAPSVLP